MRTHMPHITNRHLQTRRVRQPSSGKRTIPTTANRLVTTRQRPLGIPHPPPRSRRQTATRSMATHTRRPAVHLRILRRIPAARQGRLPTSTQPLRSPQQVTTTPRLNMPLPAPTHTTRRHSRVRTPGRPRVPKSPKDRLPRPISSRLPSRPPRLSRPRQSRTRQLRSQPTHTGRRPSPRLAPTLRAMARRLPLRPSLPHLP